MDLTTHMPSFPLNEDSSRVASVGEYEYEKEFSQSHSQRVGNGCGGCSSTAGLVSPGEYRR